MSNIISIPIEKGKKVWIDVINPTPTELAELSAKYELHQAFVQDCLDPSHLPKAERVGETTFVIARAFDEMSDETAETVQALTRKVAIFISPTMVMTVHRVDQLFIQRLREAWKETGQDRSQIHLVNSLLAKIVSSYSSFIDRTSEQADALEESVFRRARNKGLLEKSYSLKRMISIAERLIHMMEESMANLEGIGRDRGAASVKELDDRIRRAIFLLDDLELRIDHLLQLYLAIESQKNNEVMRVLTLFSAFFLPLTFIAGIYGMNFAYMPELGWRTGYPYALALMVVVSIGIALWFRKKGWIGDSDLK